MAESAQELVLGVPGLGHCLGHVAVQSGEFLRRGGGHGLGVGVEALAGEIRRPDESRRCPSLVWDDEPCLGVDGPVPVAAAVPVQDFDVGPVDERDRAPAVLEGEVVEAGPDVSDEQPHLAAPGAFVQPPNPERRREPDRDPTTGRRDASAGVPLSGRAHAWPRPHFIPRHEGPQPRPATPARASGGRRHGAASCRARP